MMNIFFENPVTERYLYHYMKTSVIIINESKAQYLKRTRTWSLGGYNIDETESYTHLDVICNKYMDLDGCVEESSKKLRGTFLSLINSGVYEDGFHLFTSKHLYDTIVLPEALYGCELWDGLTQNQLNMLEKMHRFCLKYTERKKKRRVEFFPSYFNHFYGVYYSHTLLQIVL